MGMKHFASQERLQVLKGPSKLSLRAAIPVFLGFKIPTTKSQTRVIFHADHRGTSANTSVLLGQQKKNPRIPD